MRPLVEFPLLKRRTIRYVLADIDDTLTTGGRLPSIAYTAMEKIRNAGIKMAPITGRPAGWCDLIARQWPIDGVVGENGAFFFRYDDAARTMTRRYWKEAAMRAADRRRLDVICEQILAAVPGAAVSADQPYREADLAIDFCEDVPPLGDHAVIKIKSMFEQAGAQAKVSSIHVNGWFGDYDKLAMTRILFREVFDVDLDAVRDSVVFIGDSPNDAPMFDYFPHAVGVANLSDFAGRLDAEPLWITAARGGQGFAEMVDLILDQRRP